MSLNVCLLAKALKFRASKVEYIPSNQLTLEGFENPFGGSLDPNNRWVIMSSRIPWDELVSIYSSGLKNNKTGAKGINPRIVIGAMIIKHLNGWSDRETVNQIQENIYFQYFIGLSAFVKEPIFDASTFVDFRKRLDISTFEKINNLIVKSGIKKIEIENDVEKKSHYGKLLVDATACPQDITYPTDIKIVYSAILKSEILIDLLYKKALHHKKPRTDKNLTRKIFLKIAQNKNPSKANIRKALRKLLNKLHGNINSIHLLLDVYEAIPKQISPAKYKDLLVIQEVHRQQKQMFEEKSHKIDHRIVSVHEPHVRPIVRGKMHANVEFGAKIQLSLTSGYCFLDVFSWDSYNEGKCLLTSIEKYKDRLGYYPEDVLADRIYCNRENRAKLKELGISLKAKPLGRPKAGANLVSPGERNPIEGKIGQAKTRYGLNRIMARLDITSKSWVACIVLVLNLVRLTQDKYLCVYNIIKQNQKNIEISYSSQNLNLRFAA